MTPGNGRPKGRAVTTASEVPPPIQWHEGMLLAPQHFQQMSLRHELLVHYHTSASAPYAWGVRHLEIDPVTLPDGKLRVLELEAVMPDGLLVSFNRDLPELSIDLQDHVDAMKSKPVTMHLAVVARGAGLKFADRYTSSDGGSIADQNEAHDEIKIPVLKPVLQLLAGDEPAPMYVTIPIAKIAYRNESFTRTRFDPPLLRVARGSTVYDMCNTLASRLREKASFLAEQVRSPSSSASVTQLVDTKILVHCLAGELPAFEAILRSGAAHPFPLYVALCSVAGHVAGLGQALVPPVFDPYDHNHLVATFDQVYNAVTKAIAQGVRESYLEYPFVHEGGEFHIQFDPDWSGRSVILGVRAPSGVSDHDMAQWVGASVIASRSMLLPLRDRRVTGAVRKQIDAEADLVPPRGMTLYSVSPEEEFVKPGEDFVVLNPGVALPPESIVLFVRNRV